MNSILAIKYKNNNPLGLNHFFLNSNTQETVAIMISYNKSNTRDKTATITAKEEGITAVSSRLIPISLKPRLLGIK